MFSILFNDTNLTHDYFRCQAKVIILASTKKLCHEKTDFINLVLYDAVIVCGLALFSK